ncbi:putative telomerase-binding protein est1a [Phaeomoniella chlamydospora]|uniref:Putative telomerase-binding protein est1a n=1 Tax=Phaeomoniella chlamydospora TaxID=158046 RepID=A0A0G2DZP2_PHACM|nr:putative telomerase-binding protein est1a [Phaeomoniella chlamydospora]
MLTILASKPSHLRNTYRSTSDLDSARSKDPSIDLRMSDLLSESAQPPPEMFKQPFTRPITQDQLINEVKGIYAGLVVVEKKCVEIDQQQANTTNKLTNEQYQALIALHPSQHPSASPALRKLATKYAMPARMWRHGIHSFLELLRHRLPESLEHMLAFVYLAYSMMALLMESVSSFEETWIECLGDLARYRMAIEESDLRDRETWSGVAAMWYNRAADKSPGVGRIQHHLAVLARPHIVQQLFYYTKALVTLIPFQNARESIMLLFNQFLEPNETASQRYYPVESALVKSHGIMFVKGSIEEFETLVKEYLGVLNNYIEKVTAKFRVQGPEMAVSILAAVFAFGDSQAHLFQLLHSQQSSHATTEIPEELPSPITQAPEDEEQKISDVKQYWTQHGLRQPTHPHARSRPQGSNSKFTGPDELTYHALLLMGRTMRIVFSRIGDKNTLSFSHVMLASLWSLAFVPGALEYVQAFVPWQQVALFLNTLGRHGATHAAKPEVALPGAANKPGRQLPDDFVMRGLLWTSNYYPQDFFSLQSLLPEDERNLELPSHAVYRAERCLWLGVHLSSLNHWLRYNAQTKQFSVTDFGRDLSPLLDVTEPRSTTQSPSHDAMTE